ncbi:MAG: hypothetical protein ACW964_16825 [Candidatus Hodarchaeales archaeon]
MVTESQIKNFKNEYTELDADDFSGIFRFVTKIIREVLDLSRPGILLGLVELGYSRGNFVGGFHRVGTNEIYLNHSALRVMKKDSTKKYFKAYIFHLLLHEYLHSCSIFKSDFLDESKVRELTANLSLVIFGNQHEVGKLATAGLGAYFPYSFKEAQYSPTMSELANPKFVMLKHRDSELTYI